MTRRIWAGAVLGLGMMACGPMPGYLSEPEAPTPAAPPAKVESPKAPAPDLKVDSDQGSEVVSEPLPAPSKPAPRLPARPTRPVVTPPTPEYDPAAEDAAPPQPQPPKQPMIFRPTERIPEPAPTKSGMQTIRLDDDSYYLIDAARGICFFRHKDAMAPVDCAKIPEAALAPKDRDDEANAPAPQPPRSRPPVERPRYSRPPTPPPVEPTEPTIEPDPDNDPQLAPEPPVQPPVQPRVQPKPPADPQPQPPARPTQASKLQASPDEMLRFEKAYDAIFCDRKRGDTTPPDERIRSQGLSTSRYEAIEGWWADDENAWWTLTERARRSCQ